MTNLAQYIETLKDNIDTVVAISNRTHYIFNSKDVIEIGWAMLFEIVEIVSVNHHSVIVKVKYFDEN